MKLFILNETFELENKMKSVEEIFDYIKQALEETDYNFSYMIVDGQEVHNEFEIYLEDNIKDIDEVKVVMLTTKEVIIDNIDTLGEYVQRAIPIVKSLADKFYKEPDADDWNHISELFEGIGYIFYTLESIDGMSDLNEVICDYEVWNEYVSEVKSLDKILNELKIAIENSNTVLIGDILSSEIVPVFEKMKIKLDVLVGKS